jgi:hypothetical protein
VTGKHEKDSQLFAVCDRVHELEQRFERWRLRAQPEQQPDELEQQRVRPFRLCPLLKLDIETVEHRDWLSWHKTPNYEETSPSW